MFSAGSAVKVYGKHAGTVVSVHGNGKRLLVAMAHATSYVKASDTTLVTA